MSELRQYELIAEFKDGPGECGSGGAYFEMAESPEAAIRQVVSSLRAIPYEIEAVDVTNRAIHVLWNEAEILAALVREP